VPVIVPGCGLISSNPPMMLPEPLAVKLPTLARTVFPETTLPIVENAKAPCSEAFPKASEMVKHKV